MKLSISYTMAIILICVFVLIFFLMKRALKVSKVDQSSLNDPSGQARSTSLETQRDQERDQERDWASMDEGKDRIFKLFKRFNISYLDTFYIQKLKQNESHQSDCIALVEGAVWFIDFNTWRGVTKGHREDQVWINTERLRGSPQREERGSESPHQEERESESPYQEEQINHLHVLNAFSQAMKRIASVKKLKKAKICRAVIFTHGTPHIDGLKSNELVLSHAQLKARFKQKAKKEPEAEVSDQRSIEDTKKLWKFCNKIHQNTDLDQAREAHIQIVQLS